jgi:hypothetical protein
MDQGPSLKKFHPPLFFNKNIERKTKSLAENKWL